MTSTLFNWVCWGLFGLVWISGGIYNSYKAPATQQKRFRYDSLFIAVLALLAMRYVPLRFQTVMKFHIPWLQVLGTALLLLSTLFTVWSRWVLGKMWANHAAVKTEHRLVTNVCN